MKKIKIGVTIVTIIVAAVLIGMSGIRAMANSSSKNIKADYARGRIIVKFKGDVKPFRLVKVSKGREMDKVKEYRAKANVVYAEPDYKVFALGAATTTDTAYSNQWALNDIGQEIYRGSGGADNPADESNPIGSGSPDADIDWNEAWQGFSTSNWAQSATTSVVVAIVDSGVDLSCGGYSGHPDLNDKVIAGYDYIGGDKCPHDVYGHGTHVAGIAAAETNNGIGIAGVAFPDNIKILAIRVLDENGMGYTSDVASGIREAADYGVANEVNVVINLSLGGRDSKTLKEAADYGWNKGVLLAAAAGNDGGGRKNYPASYGDVISVAATDYNDNTASFSNFNNQVEVAAPGVNVFSTFPSYPFTLQAEYGRSEYYDVGSGTSMSVPHVAGLAALLFAEHPDYTNSEVRDIIDKSADDLGAPGRDNHYGYGRINVYNALTTGETTPSPSECLKNGRYCNCNGKCDKFETTASCSWDCQ